MPFLPIKDSPLHGVNEKGEVMYYATGRILKGHKDRHGSIIYCLSPNYKYHTAHELVAERFLPPPKENQRLIHKDGNNSNNDVSNLKWVNKKEYQRHLYSQGKNRSHRGKQNRPVVINETGEEFESISECARHLKVNSSSIRQQLNGISKTCKGHTFSYIKN